MVESLDTRQREEAQLALALQRFRPAIEQELRQALADVSSEPALAGFYGQIAYHLGWVDAELHPTEPVSGKLLRPALVMSACELAATVTGAKEAEIARRREQALPAAAAVELLHNFSLIHDDIEDRDQLRRHRPTLWSIWGEAQGINTGDALFCVTHLTLWKIADRGVAPGLTLQLTRLLERTALTLCEGQYLDMSFESHADISPTRYLDMITRKTAALMRAATEIGARIGAPKRPGVALALADFGQELGIAFQLRDDLLGIWADRARLGKVEAGDVRRKKMSLPVIVALAHSSQPQHARLLQIYATPGETSEAEIAEVLTLLAATDAQAWCRQVLAEHCQAAQLALDRVGDVPLGAEAGAALASLIRFVALTA